jgi:TRAP-type C4-dicarboxylate transport system substrate-binding protein
MNKSRSFLAVLALCCAAALIGLSPAANAQAQYTWKMVNLNRANETWIWQKWLADEMAKRSKGRIRVEMISLPELGLTGFELVRVMRGGLVDVGEIISGYVAGDLPIVEGPSLTGLQPDWESSRKSQKAWEEIYRRYEVQLGGKYLGSHPYDWNAAYCVKPIRRLDDLKGVKIRVFSPSMALFWKSLGAEPVSMAFSELYSAMERKALDCAHTGPASGLAVRLPEVSKFLVDMRLGHQPGLIVASKKSWDALPKDLQEMMVVLGREYTERSWTLGKELTEREIKRNQSQGVEWIPVKAEYNATIQGIVQNTLLPDWLQRNKDKDEATKAFNQHLAPLVGITAR